MLSRTRFYFLAALYLCSRTSSHPPMEDPSMFEGDIELRPYQIAELAMEDAGIPTFAMKKGGSWPKPKSIPYHIDRSLARHKKAIFQAINELESKTCLRFRKKKSNEKAYLKFTTGSGCFSPVGYDKKKYNRIQLGRGCRSKGIVLHEMLHSLGFWHEQNRPDRNRYVKIVYSNIKSKWAYAFKKRTYGQVDSKGSPYDFDSIMHYRSNAFAIDRSKKTIITKNPRKQKRIGNRKRLSRQDVKQLKAKYCR